MNSPATMAKALALTLMVACPLAGAPLAHASSYTQAGWAQGGLAPERGGPERTASARMAANSRPTHFAIAFTDLSSRNGRIISRSQQVMAAPGGAHPSGFLQCVPYAREVSGIQLRGDAHTWWAQAAGRYQRGFTPRVGAVMAFKPHGPMVLGHVATVSRILDSRRVLVRHANWSPLGGERGQIEDNVLAMDVSPRNDWSEVRVWYQPLGGLGTTHWPVSGFIYNNSAATPARPNYDASNHGSVFSRYLGDPIGAIIAVYARHRT